MPLRVVSLSNLDEMARFLAYSRGTDVSPVSMSDLSAKVHPFLTFLPGLSLAVRKWRNYPIKVSYVQVVMVTQGCGS